MTSKHTSQAAPFLALWIVNNAKSRRKVQIWVHLKHRRGYVLFDELTTSDSVRAKTWLSSFGSMPVVRLIVGDDQDV